MTIARRWVAICDTPDCGVTEILDGDQYDERAALDEQISDHGWNAQPSGPDHCPDHGPRSAHPPRQFDAFLREQLADPEVRAGYKASRAEELSPETESDECFLCGGPKDGPSHVVGCPPDESRHREASTNAIDRAIEELTFEVRNVLGCRVEMNDSGDYTCVTDHHNTELDCAEAEERIVTLAQAQIVTLARVQHAGQATTERAD